MKWLAALGVLLAFGMGAVVFLHDSNPSGGGVPSSAKVATISHGEAVTIENHMPSSGLTIVEFYADW